MKRTFVLLAAAGAALLSGGCANAPTFGIAADRMEVVDVRKIAVIEDYAKRSGLTVIWLREPTKLVDRVAVAKTPG